MHAPRRTPVRTAVHVSTPRRRTHRAGRDVRRVRHVSPWVGRSSRCGPRADAPPWPPVYGLRHAPLCADLHRRCPQAPARPAPSDGRWRPPTSPASARRALPDSSLAPSRRDLSPDARTAILASAAAWDGGGHRTGPVARGSRPAGTRRPVLPTRPARARLLDLPTTPRTPHPKPGAEPDEAAAGLCGGMGRVARRMASGVITDASAEWLRCSVRVSKPTICASVSGRARRGCHCSRTSLDCEECHEAAVQDYQRAEAPG